MVGGRCKLATDLEPMSVQKDLGAQKRLRMDEMEKEKEKEERRERRQQRMLDAFLREHHFDDVNAMRITNGWFGRSFQRPLHKAAQLNHVPVIMMLLRRGADPMSLDSKGKTAYSCSAESLLTL